jgi:rhamnose utilization protein RhaD (predicted bifunctional aldolase and dehydrogenase)
MTDLVDSALQSLRVVSARLGSDPMHVQGPGGNTSLKLAGGQMWIKASGFELCDALDRDIFARVDGAGIALRVSAREVDPLGGCWDPSGLKPSIETTLHALMPHPVVLHTHSITAIALACSSDAEARLGALLPDIPHAFVPYAKPGLDLALGVLHGLERRPDARVVILGNHGIVVGGATAAAAAQLLVEVTERLAAPVRTGSAPDHARLQALALEHGLLVPESASTHRIALDDVSVAIATGGTLYPDHVVFLGSGVGLLRDRAAQRANPSPAIPKLWLEPGVGVLLEPGLPSAARAMALALSDTIVRLPSVATCRYLTLAEESALLGMEEEKYRQRLARQLFS